MDLEPPKRQRFTPIPGEQIKNADGTYINNSLLQSPGDKANYKVTETEESIREPDALDNAKETEVSSLLQRVRWPIITSAHLTNTT
jgi:hypothetical protein